MLILMFGLKEESDCLFLVLFEFFELEMSDCLFWVLFFILVIFVVFVFVSMGLVGILCSCWWIVFKCCVMVKYCCVMFWLLKILLIKWVLWVWWLMVIKVFVK